jgi:hypothetical protein
LEIILPKRRIYIQVKTRSHPLIHSDIAGALERFKALRTEHERSARKGRASFLIVSNIGPGPELRERIDSADWSNDISIASPGSPPTEPWLPQPWSSAVEGLSKCSELASLPFGTLAPETLVFKLAGLVMAAAAGTAPRTDHTFRLEELTELFEQLLIQLQEFPAPPPLYRPQSQEPALVAKAPIRIITGFSGAGKTAWVAQAALHANTALIYFDVGDTPATALAVPLARELAGHFFGKNGALGEILLPGATGIEILKLLARKLKSENIAAAVVIDNAHRASAEHLGAIIRQAPNLGFLLLCQPGALVQELEATLALSSEPLRGWTSDTIAAESADEGCKVTPASAQELLNLTAGLPLYVQSAVRVASKEYGGDLAAFCADLARQTHSVATAQEVILSKVFQGLQATYRDAVSVLSISDIPLDRAEASEFLQSVLSLDVATTARFLRDMRPMGVIEVFGADRFKIHDAIRLLGHAHFESMPAGFRQQARISFKAILLRSMVRERNLAKLSLYLRLLGDIGDMRSLVEFATDELFHELGVIQQISGVLENASISSEIAPAERFAALDGLVFSDLKNGETGNASKRIALMAALIEEHHLDESDQLTLLMKEVHLASIRHDADAVAGKLAQASDLLPDNPMHRRIFRYNAAHALFKLKRYDSCIAETSQLIPEYYDVLGLTIGDVIARNPDKILPLLKKGEDHTDDLKHLADCLDLQACALDAVGQISPFGRIHAIKFYAMAHALDSVVRVGQDLADEFIGRNDYFGARDVLERSVLPNVIGHKMTSRLVPVRAQYAVVLAYCGEHAAAEAEMASLRPYEAGLSDEGRRELSNQMALIGELQIRPPAPRWTFPEPRGKIGRNKPCYCGSGKKFKRCHGINS